LFLDIHYVFAVFSPVALSNILRTLLRICFFVCLFALLLAAHLAHSGVLWEGDVLPAAAALQMSHGAVLYRDVWFDKPLLVPAIYLLWGAHIGIALRAAGAVYAFVACLLAFAFGLSLGGREREGYWAAGLMGFFLTFDTHSGVLPLAADMLLLVPHLAAVWLAYRKQPMLAGAAAGIGFLFNTKGVFVLIACAFFSWPAILPLAAGFVIPNLCALAWLMGTGSLAPYIDQVWRWPALYAASPVVADPIWNGLVRTVNWLGFHVVLVVGSAIVWWKRPQWRFLAWTLICFAGVVPGWRFFPRYFLLLLPPLVIAAAYGLANLRAKWVLAVAILTMAVPLVRFGPRYFKLTDWSDLAMDRDSQEAAKIALQQPGKTLYVWGYRPELYLYTNLRPSTRYLDSQALTGVPADRHLTQSGAVLTEGTAEARAELARSNPDILIDGLSPFNPALSMDHYPELRDFIVKYRPIARTHGTVIYIRRID
jgi:hypothetical protein